MIGIADAWSSQPVIGDEERAVILSHGPWPPEHLPDPSNQYSGDPDAIEFGRHLFHSPKLSKGEILSCANCHQPERAFMDGVPLNRGLQMLTRNTPSVLNLRWQKWFGWDGANDNLWAQSIRPILTEAEMNLTPAEIKNNIVQDPLLSCGFKRTFGQPVDDIDEPRVTVLVGKALAAYQETLVSPPTSFDRFVSALSENDMEKMAAYPDDALRGLKIFVGKGSCSLCHFGPLFSNGEFANIGISYFIRPGVVDKGRFGGIDSVKASPYNLLGEYNDERGKAGSALRTRHVSKQFRNWGEFKIPSLRNVSETGPYMHNGSLASLEDVINHYSELNEERLHADGEKIFKPLNLTTEEKADLKSFLLTLSAPLDRLYEESKRPFICGG